MSQAQATQTATANQATNRRSRGTKETTHMTPTPNQNLKSTTRTVFDLETFDDVRLAKQYEVPAKPANVAAALAHLGNNEQALLDIIHRGLIAQAGDAAYNTMDGFRVIGDGNAVKPETWGELYTGKYADEETGAKIDAAILSLAKLNGYEKSLPKAQKDALKAEAVEFLRSNPKMLANLAGTSAAPPAV